MKKVILSLTFVLLQLWAVRAQYMSPDAIDTKNFKTLDSVSLVVNYKMTYINTILERDSSTMIMNDNQELLIGKGISKYYSSDLLDGSIRLNNHDYSKFFERGTCSFEIFKNYPQGKLTYIDQTSKQGIGNKFIYNEKLPEFNWKISDDTLTILSYLCQKACCSFRGRMYTAWFAVDIPVNNGPWKFGGLPGLILKIEDSTNYYRWECVGLRQLEKPQALQYYNFKYASVSRTELYKVYRQFFKDPIAFWIAIRSENRGQFSQDMIPPYRFNPIELE